MSLINPKFACGVCCVLVMYASGQEDVQNSGDRLREENAARLREFAKNNNMGGARRPMSPEMDKVSNKPDLVENLKSEDLARMTLEDPLLKWAYAEVFLRSMGRFEQLAPPQELALADMRRRGEAVSPMLLKLISENQENIIESAILVKIGFLDTVRVEPFLEYARKLLRERTQTMTGESAGVAAYILGRHGTHEDEALLEWVINERPYVAYTMDKELKILRHRLDTSPSAPRPERRETHSLNSESDARNAKGTENLPEGEAAAATRTKPWLISGLILVMLLGLYRLLRKGLRGNAA